MPVRVTNLPGLPQTFILLPLKFPVWRNPPVTGAPRQLVTLPGKKNIKLRMAVT